METKTSAKHIRKFVGIVTSAAMQKTVVVRVDNMKLHPKYRKHFRVSKKYHIHDKKGLAKLGDQVEFVEGRPMSKTKRWYLKSIVKGN